MEGLPLRVKDLNFEYLSLHVLDGKGAKDRVVTFPLQLHATIRVQLQQVQLQRLTGAGNIFFHPTNYRLIPVRGEKCALTSTLALCRKRLDARCSSNLAIPRLTQQRSIHMF